ncbi:creatininase family protein [Hyphococcus flavus]|uniref:Creatininase family protein n=1 Tax=Hyphococcus flavus TaxID=1866326 RepID=A0AAF0CG59_9PROT|nr:creatininase family protein [Hyphococcus flavus]WDI31994.1 creatininase family protein [Hyphococcus flavus]
MLMALSTWQEIEAYLSRSTGIIVPIGSFEQHGPNGLVGTDALCPEIIANAGAADRDDILIAPTFSVGCAQHHLAFPGTITLRPSTMIAAMTDWVASLRRHGFRRIYFLNGHGGNIATIQAAFSEIYADDSFSTDGPGNEAVKMTLRNWWDLSGIEKLCLEMYPKGHGSHATPSEVSVTYFAYPEAVKSASMEPEIAPSGPIRDAHDYRRRFPDGRIGSNPAQSSAQDGEKIVTAAAKALLDDYESFLSAT